MIFVIAFTSWTYMARIIRGQMLSLREKEFVEAARSVGASDGRIIFREILPEPHGADHRLRLDPDPPGDPLRSGAIVPRRGRPAANVELGPDDRRRYTELRDAWWYMVFPGLALLFTVLAFNLIGDAMQDALNPRADKT